MAPTKAGASGLLLLFVHGPLGSWEPEKRAAIEPAGPSRVDHVPAAIARHPWPGNVRELQNRIQRAVIMADGNLTTTQNMELTGIALAALPTLKEARENLERDLTIKA